MSLYGSIPESWGSQLHTHLLSFSSAEEIMGTEDLFGP